MSVDDLTTKNTNTAKLLIRCGVRSASIMTQKPEHLVVDLHLLYCHLLAIRPVCEFKSSHSLLSVFDQLATNELCQSCVSQIARRYRLGKASGRLITIHKLWGPSQAGNSGRIVSRGNN